MKTKLFFVLAILSLLLVAAAPLSSGGPLDGGPVIFGGNYTLASGDTLNGDLVVFGGNVTIEADAQVKGSIVIFGGNISLDGTMTGDLVLIGGSGAMGEKAVIGGDLVKVGASFSQAEGARIEGEIREEPAIEIPAPTIPEAPSVPEIPAVPNVPEPPIWNPVGSAFGVLGQAVLIAALAMLLVLFLRPQMERVAQAFTLQPLVAGGVGLLTVFVFPLLLVFMAVTIILILGIPFAVLALVLAWLFGIVSLGMEVGERFTRAIGQVWSPVLTAGFGTFLLVLVVEGIGLAPCIGWLAPFLVGVTGVGAVLLTWIDSRTNPPRAAAPAPGLDEALPPAS
jgi:hypothetical protein